MTALSQHDVVVSQLSKDCMQRGRVGTVAGAKRWRRAGASPRPAFPYACPILLLEAPSLWFLQITTYSIVAQESSLKNGVCKASGPKGGA